MVYIQGCSGIDFSKADKAYHPEQANFGKINYALVLGGGGAKGIAHLGVIEELEKAGLRPDIIIGCSAGSIVGGLYASDPNIDNLKQKILFGKKSEVVSYSISKLRYSVFSPLKLKKYLEKNLAVQNFEELKIPLVVSATNLEFGDHTYFSKGDLVQAIMASSALPGAFPPVEIEDQYFVDCGVADPVPVQIAEQLGAKTIVAVNIASKLSEGAPNHMLGLIKRSLEISYMHQSEMASRRADVIIDFDFRNIDTFSEEHKDYLYQEGLKAGKKAVSQLRDLL